MRFSSVAAGVISAGIDLVIFASFDVAPGKLPISWLLGFSRIYSQLFLFLICDPILGVDARNRSKL